MKKLILIALLAFGVISQAAAHQMSFNPDAGETIPDWSTHVKVYY